MQCSGVRFAATATADGAAAASEVPADIQAAYVAQYLAEVERIRRAAAVAAGVDEKKVDLKGELPAQRFIRPYSVACCVIKPPGQHAPAFYILPSGHESPVPMPVMCVTSCLWSPPCRVRFFCEVA